MISKNTFAQDAKEALRKLKKNNAIRNVDAQIHVLSRF
jgi:hypothetical protein